MGAEGECWETVIQELELVFNQNPMGLRLSSFKDVVEIWGIGSGKSFFVSMAFSYGAYRLLCLKNPQRAFGLARGSTIALINMSKSGQQAKKVVFGEIKARIMNSPWFMNNYPPDPNVHSELRFAKSITIFPGNSQETFPLGYNVYLANIDEANFQTETDSRDVAAEIYDAMERRVTGRFGVNGLIFLTSSPRYEDDFTERKAKEALTSPVVLARRKPVWEMRPDDRKFLEVGDVFEMEHPQTKQIVKIPSKYEASFKRNPQKAWRDFGSMPSLVLEPYFASEEIDRIRLAMENVKPVMVEDKRWTGKCHPVKTPHFVHIDLGLKRDACGFALGHYENKKAHVDLILRIVCEARAIELEQKGQPYDLILGKNQIIFDDVRDIVRRLTKMGYPIQRVSYDGFQSVDSRQILEAEGYQTALISVDRDTIAYDTLKSLVNTGRFECYKHPFALYEFTRLELKDGEKVDHPPLASKDCADAIAGLCRNMMEDFDEVVEEEETVTIDQDLIRVEISDQI